MCVGVHLMFIIWHPDFGHYTAGPFNPNILVINAMMANLLLLTDYSPKGWQYGLNIMPNKTLGDFNIKKLYIICYLRQILMPTTNGLVVQSCSKPKHFTF